MSATNIAELDELIKKATSETIPNGEIDMPVAFETSDVIRSKKLPPRECMRSLKKRITSTASNPNTHLASWKLVDICIKNGGIPFIVEICSREFMDFLENTIVKYNNEGNEIEFTTKKIFYELYVTFKNDSQLNYVSKVYDKLLNSKGVTFSDELKGNVADAKAMFDSKVPADWIDSDACMICSNKFSFLNRRHHCRSCGGIFCQEHSSNFIPLPDLGLYENVRVCDNCFNDYDSKKSSSPKKKHTKKHKKRIDNDEDEDEQLRKAIELSLKESRGDAIEPVIPIVKPERPTSTNNNVEVEDDAELKAAIEASLREAEEEKQRREREQQEQIYQQPAQQFELPSFEFSPEDEDAIYLFASMVEKMKTQTVGEVLQNSSAQKLYEHVLASKPKLNKALVEKNQKYNSLMEMNGKISEIMNIYDNLLEQQLHNINISSQYSMPTPPAIQQQTPYAYYQQPRQQPVQYAPVQTTPVAQQAQPSTLDQLRSVEITPQTTDATQLPYPSESQQSLDEVIEPSEPIYPNDEEEPNHEEKEEKEKEQGLPQLEENVADHQETVSPYPVENGSAPSTPQKSSNKANITQYNFPTVPVQKLPDQLQSVEEAETPKEEEEEPKEEPLLIEL